jgi:hypothetical protein
MVLKIVLMTIVVQLSMCCRLEISLRAQNSQVNIRPGYETGDHFERSPESQHRSLEAAGVRQSQRLKGS